MNKWPTIYVNDAKFLLDQLTWLQQLGWVFRGHGRIINRLLPSIDRIQNQSILPRVEKLRYEDTAISSFQRSIALHSREAEQHAIEDKFVALMKLQHYLTPTRLLDWTRSPLVALSFSSNFHVGEDFEIWTFSYKDYEFLGKKQWEKYPENTNNGTGIDSDFNANLTCFLNAEPNSWISLAFYPQGFPRQDVQYGLYSFMPNFNIDHSEALEKLLDNNDLYFRYVVDKSLKNKIRDILRLDYGITIDSLFPDIEGAAYLAKNRAENNITS